MPAATAIALGLAAVRLVWAAGHALALVVLAATLAAALAPVVGRVARGMRRTLAVAFVYLTGVAALALVGWLTLPRFASEFDQFANRAPDIAAALREQIQPYLPAAVSVDGVVSWVIDQARSAVQQVPMQVASFVVELLVVVFLSIYFLTVSPRLHWFLVSLFPRARRRRASLIACRMARAMGGYFRGVAIDAAIIGVLTWAALSIVGLEFAVPLAVLAAMGEFVPYIGPVIAAVPAVAVGLLDSVQQGVIVLVIYVLLQQIESHIVTPNVMRTQTAVHPATVIVALTVGFTVGGLLGAIVAIPIFAAARVLLIHLVAPAVRRAGRRVTAAAHDRAS